MTAQRAWAQHLGVLRVQLSISICPSGNAIMGSDRDSKRATFTFCSVAPPLNLCLETSQGQLELESSSSQILLHPVLLTSPQPGEGNSAEIQHPGHLSTLLCLAFISRAKHIICTA